MQWRRLARQKPRIKLVSVFIFLNRGHVPCFLKLFFKKCVYVWLCAYAICLSFCTHVTKHFKLESNPYTIKKAKPSLHYTYVQVSSASKVGFFLKSKTRYSNSSDFEACFYSQLFRHSTTKNISTRPHKHPENASFVFWNMGLILT